jgi:hypothetical protein
MPSMKFLNLLLLACLTVPATVNACEGDCIVGITDAFLGNYSEPVQRVILTAVRIFNAYFKLC